jgi:hypothetical protein
MEILDNKTDDELLQSLLVESAKAKNEIRCALNDIDKVNSRLTFNLLLINTILDRRSKG